MDYSVIPYKIIATIPNLAIYKKKETHIHTIVFINEEMKIIKLERNRNRKCIDIVYLLNDEYTAFLERLRS